MSTRNDVATGSPQREMVMERIFDAPRDLVFKAWTDPKHVSQWWGPKGFTNPVCELDVRPGGDIRIHMTGPDGVVYPTTGVFHEIVAPERLVMTTSAFADEAGNPQLEVLNTVTFAEHNGKTKLTLRAVIVKSTPAVDAALDGMEEGWSQSLDRLADELRSSGYSTGAAIMTNTQAQQQSPTPNPDLKSLDRLVGNWKVSGGVQGQITYEWMEGGFFLMQHVALGGNRGLEIIGHEQPFGAEPSADIKSRYYGSMGETFDYVYEMDGDTLTIWAGEKGSPAYYKGTLSTDGNTLTGEWVYPGGGGYASTSTRVK